MEGARTTRRGARPHHPSRRAAQESDWPGSAGIMNGGLEATSRGRSRGHGKTGSSCLQGPRGPVSMPEIGVDAPGAPASGGGQWMTLRDAVEWAVSARRARREVGPKVLDADGARLRT